MNQLPKELEELILDYVWTYRTKPRTSRKFKYSQIISTINRKKNMIREFKKRRTRFVYSYADRHLPLKTKWMEEAWNEKQRQVRPHLQFSLMCVNVKIEPETWKDDITIGQIKCN